MHKLLSLLFLLPILANAQNTWENFSYYNTTIKHPFTNIYIPTPQPLRPYKWEIIGNFLFRISKTNDTIKYGPFPTITGYNASNKPVVQSIDGRAVFIRNYSTYINNVTYYKNSVGYCDGTTLKFFDELTGDVEELRTPFTATSITKKYIWVSQSYRILRYTIADGSATYFTGNNDILQTISDKSLIEGDSAGQAYLFNAGKFFRYADSTDVWEDLTRYDLTVRAQPTKPSTQTNLAGELKLYLFEKGILKTFDIPKANLLGKPTSASFNNQTNTLIAYYENGFVVKESEKISTTFFKDYFQPPSYITATNYSTGYSYSENGHSIIKVSNNNSLSSFFFLSKDGISEYKGNYLNDSYSSTYVDQDNNFYYSYTKRTSNGNVITNKLIRIKNQFDTTFIDMPKVNSVYGMSEDRNFIWIRNEGGGGFGAEYEIMRLRKSKTIIHGILYYDFNKNGVKDTEDVPYTKSPIIIYPRGITLYPSVAGQFSFGGNSDEQYTLAILEDSLFDFSSQKLPATLSHTTVNKIGISYKNVTPSVKTNFYMPWPRCNTKPTASLNIVNDGYVAIEKLTLTLSSDGKTKFFLDAAATKGGDTLKFEITNLGIGASKHIEYAIGIPGPGTTTSLKLNSSIYSNNTLSSSKADSISSIVRCSFDPNDKAVSPAGVGEENFTLKKSRLTYLIRFENTGNDTAYHVVIKDSLSASLNKSTFEVLGSSHSVVTEKTKQGVLTFTFNKIMLPDSTTNKAKAQGWVRFAINPTNNLPEGVAINNKAYIVFDSNEPVITNTVTSTMVTSLPVILEVIDASAHKLSYYPNPAKDFIQVSSEVVNTEVYNSLGKLLLQTNENRIDISKLNAGLHILKLHLKSGSIIENKMIKN